MPARLSSASSEKFARSPISPKPKGHAFALLIGRLAARLRAVGRRRARFARSLVAQVGSADGTAPSGGHPGDPVRAFHLAKLSPHTDWACLALAKWSVRFQSKR